MNKKIKGKIYYVCFYSEKEVESKITTYPSVLTKIDYVVSTIKKLGKEVEILSIAPSKKGKFNGYFSRIDHLETHRYISSALHKNKILNKLSFLIQSNKILKYLKKHVQEEDRVVVYHSLYNRIWLKKYLKRYKNKVILQIEDVFSEIAHYARHFKNAEWNLFNMSNKCLCVNDILLDSLVCVPNKIVSYGSYNLPKQFTFKSVDKIKLVYAGVIEQTRNAAFLAVSAMKYLPKKYELHILGFGNSEDILALRNHIKLANENEEKVYFHGRKSGEEYTRFLQGCQIALSTHSYDSKDDASANYTFPSKILTYLANNLRVVAQRLTVLERSQVSSCITYYDRPKPEELANAIEKINLQEEYNSREIIQKLDKDFRLKISKLLAKN